MSTIGRHAVFQVAAEDVRGLDPRLVVAMEALSRRWGMDAFSIARLERNARTKAYRSRSIVIGTERMRLPVAWKTALAIAAAMPTSPISPTPFTPTGL